MQGRQCHYQKLKQSQDTRVNAGGQSLSAPVISGTAPLAHTPFPQIWGDLEQRAGSTAIQHTPEISRSFDRYPDIGYHSLSASLAFLRWRRLISPRIEVTINPALLSPSSLSDSISATTSCGTRTVKSCDFAFLLEVAITDSFVIWCVSVYAKKVMRNA
ncbi:hypothetical protein CQA18_09320 [Enterobacter hormaechei]|nr:hypothetical protein CQA18_09320 [Enterobacter hormaechei]